MGVVNITTNAGEGLYDVSVIKDLERALEDKATAQSDINSMNLNILSLGVNILAKEQSINTIQERIDTTILDIQNENLPADDEYKKIVSETSKDIELRANELNDLRGLNSRKAILEIGVSSKQKFIDLVTEKENETDNRSMWCCDYKIDLALTNDINSVEIGREKTTIFIAPHTYVIVQNDIDRLTDIIVVKNANLSATDDLILANESDTDAINLLITSKHVELSQTSDIEARNTISKEIKTLTVESLQLAADGKALKEIKSDIENQIVADTAEKALLTSTGVGNIFVPTVGPNTKKLQPVISNGSPGTYFNKSLLPGVQRFIPTYRTGVLTAITGDSCTVLMDDTRSSQKNSVTLEFFNINYDPADKTNLTPTLTNVPIRYGECNGSVFAVNDAVLISFEEKAISGEIILSPKVIGFTSSPKPCTVILARHALGKIYQYFSDAAKAPVFIFDLLTVSGAQISPLTLIQGLAIKGADIFTAVNGTLSKNGITIGTTSVANPFFIACSQSDDYIFISGLAVSNTDIQIERFNINTNISDGIIVLEATVGSSFAIRASANRIGQFYYNSIGTLVFGIWQKDGTSVLDYVAPASSVGLNNWVAAYKDMFIYTTSSGSVYSYNFLTEDGVNFGSVTPPMADVHPGLDFVTYSLGCVSATNNQLWLMSAVNGGFSFWTVYQLDITYISGVPSAVALGNGGAYLFQKTALVGSEYSRSDGWIHGQTA